MLRLTQNGRMYVISNCIVYLGLATKNFSPDWSSGLYVAKQTISLLTFNFILEECGNIIWLCGYGSLAVGPVPNF